jgi:uncharacterized membrane protein YgcG
MLKQIALATLSAAAIVTVLTAADFWTKKPYTDWTDEESQKMVTDSPWAWRKAVDTGRSGPEGSITQPVTLLWQSAMPVKRAMYGKTAATNPQAKTLLERQETIYLLRLNGVPLNYKAKTDVEKIKMATTVKVKGKDPVHPSEVQIPETVAPKGFGPPGSGKGFGGAPKGNNFQNNFQRGGGGGGKGGGGGGDFPGGGAPAGGGGFAGPSFDVYFAFPKSLDVKAEDQEMEFETHIGGLILKHKFKLKDMVYEGKLEL